MKVLYEKTLKDGRRHALVELMPGEELEQPLKADAFYRLQYPMDDQVYAGYILQNPERVVWDTLEQKWLS
jgi:hypothetical protein